MFHLLRPTSLYDYSNGMMPSCLLWVDFEFNPSYIIVELLTDF